MGLKKIILVLLLSLGLIASADALPTSSFVHPDAPYRRPYVLTTPLSPSSPSGYSYLLHVKPPVPRQRLDQALGPGVQWVPYAAHVIRVSSIETLVPLVRQELERIPFVLYVEHVPWSSKLHIHPAKSINAAHQETTEKEEEEEEKEEEKKEEKEEQKMVRVVVQLHVDLPLLPELNIQTKGRIVDISLPQRLLPQLAQLDHVASISTRAAFHPQNYHAQSVIQRTTRDPFVHNMTTRRTPLYDGGLRGQGQILAHGDTGVDYDSCYFFDPAYPTPTFGPGESSNTHRKIVTYVSFTAGGQGDAYMGHGTHTAGTLAGEACVTCTENVPSHLSRYNGVASASKLAIYDFQKTGLQFEVPVGIYDEFFGDSHAAGARISSNSWGNPLGDYEWYTQEMDRFAWDHQDFLPVFSAGNYGTNNGGSGNIATPSVGKNCLTVGSVHNAVASLTDNGEGVHLLISTPGRSKTFVPFFPATFGPSLSQAPLLVGVQVLRDSQLNGCRTFSIVERERVRGRVVVSQRTDNCPFIDKARHIQEAGGVMSIVIWPQGQQVVSMAGDDKDKTISILSASVSSQYDAFLQEGVFLVGPVFEAAHLASHTPEFLSRFSSKGPTHDVRIKPDVLGPGESLVSAGSDGTISTSGTCGHDTLLHALSGTSMACPAVAGGAALVRQYFVDGYHPSGTPRDADRWGLVLASLIKAMIIHSAMPIGSLPNDAIPSFQQGFGRVELANVLRLVPANPLPGLALFPIQRANPGIETSQEHVFCFRASATMKTEGMRVTLVWQDYPSALVAASKLVNDLDLTVATSSGQIMLGNNQSYSDSTGTHRVWDFVNNVEQAVLPKSLLAGEFVSVHVHGAHVPKGPQPYALVVSGQHLEQQDDISQCATTALVCPGACGMGLGHGHCSRTTGHCICADTFLGPDCSIESTHIHNGTFLDTLWVDSQGWRYFHMSIDKDWLFNGTFSLFVDMQNIGDEGGDPDVYANIGAFPTLSEFVAVDSSPAATAHLRVEDADLRRAVQDFHGRVTIGVFGYCCQRSTFSLQVRLKRIGDQQDDPGALIWWWWLLIAGMGGGAFAFGMWWWWQKRRRNIHNYGQVIEEVIKEEKEATEADTTTMIIELGPMAKPPLSHEYNSSESDLDDGDVHFPPSPEL